MISHQPNFLFQISGANHKMITEAGGGKSWGMRDVGNYRCQWIDLLGLLPDPVHPLITYQQDSLELSLTNDKLKYVRLSGSGNPELNRKKVKFWNIRRRKIFELAIVIKPKLRREDHGHNPGVAMLNLKVDFQIAAVPDSDQIGNFRH